MGTAAIVRWTGRGAIDDLGASLKGVLRVEEMKADVRRAGGSFIIEGADPVGAAALFRHMPGVSWAAVGRTSDSVRGLGKAAFLLAPAYLKRGETFSVIAEASVEGVTSSDVSGAVTSSILEAVKGARVAEERAKVKFRVAYEGGRSAVGVELWEGPGGIAVGSEIVQCLVSGGMHSSVVAWYALLSGCKVKLIHAKVDESSLREVAKLYSELSNRVDPSGLSLEVLEGRSPAGVLKQSLRRSTGPVYGGFHTGCSRIPRGLVDKVDAPLFLLTEEGFTRAFSGLSLKGQDAKEGWREVGVGGMTSRSFGGQRGDMHAVLDGLT